MSRQLVHQVLSTTPELIALVGDRIFQGSSMLTAQVVKPFVVYSMGNNTDEGMTDPDSFQPSRQFFTVYIHDEKGDYSRIDDVVRVMKRAFLTAPLTGDVCGLQYLETSADHDDPTLQSIMKYVRFQQALAR